MLGSVCRKCKNYSKVARINQRQDFRSFCTCCSTAFRSWLNRIGAKSHERSIRSQKGHGFSGRLEWCDTHRNFLLAFKGTQLSHLCTKPLIALLGYTSPGPPSIALAFLSLA